MHGCSGDRMFLEHERNYGLGMDAAGPRMLLEHEQNYGLCMDALVIACSWNMNGIMVWAWMLRGPVCSWNTNRIMVCAWMLW